MKRLTPHPPRRCSLWLAALLSLCQAALAQTSPELTLEDVLSTTLERAMAGDNPLVAAPYQASSWLAGLPSLNLSYLGSEDRYGVDESEFSVNLPLKSGRRRSALARPAAGRPA